MSTSLIKGHVADDFGAVKMAFEANFNEGLEAGAGFCVYKDGELIVDLIGGTKDRKQEQHWQADTLVPVFSTTKAVAALVIAWLYDTARLDYNQTVASLWPEFGQHGKDELTIAQALSHQAGLSGITEPMQPKDWFDWEGMCSRLAAQKPIWEPGTASGYHPVTYGFLAGEIARLADAKHRTLGTILREEFCAPNDIDFFIGTPEDEHGRCADLHKPRSMSDLGEINEATKAAFLNPWSSPGGRGTAAWREFEFAGANGHGTAKAVARLMQLALDGHIGDTQILGENTLYEMSRPRISGPNLVLPFDLTIACGFMVNSPNQFYGPNTSTIGHSGWGGSCAFADPITGITCAYVMNKQSNILIGDPRPMKLIAALYECL
ncbi:MAG: beta-lactamase family protein [Robiginitomaculum sp.]|nr:beta-lactamase family protein [Robiginitomaculum sp.]